jgi:hypothetical protein
VEFNPRITLQRCARCFKVFVANRCMLLNHKEVDGSEITKTVDVLLYEPKGWRPNLQLA